MVDAKGDAGMGMIKARKLFNDLHVKLSEAGFSEVNAQIPLAHITMP